MEDLYDAAERAGLLTPVVVGTTTVHCAFRAPDETVLEGLALARDFEIEYAASRLALAPGDVVTIVGQSYRVREVSAFGDGRECRAKLARLP
ncbi:head-tail joining protein [Thermomonas flagellata]|uniref:head-tail joining protein n=1 Tax=Thermomonas flagellata TaxID=2888524 RepID=UPI003CE4C437